MWKIDIRGLKPKKSYEGDGLKDSKAIFHFHYDLEMDKYFEDIKREYQNHPWNMYVIKDVDILRDKVMLTTEFGIGEIDLKDGILRLIYNRTTNQFVLMYMADLCVFDNVKDFRAVVERRLLH